MFNILENLNDEVSAENSNIFRAVELSNFIEKDRFHFAEKLFNFEDQIYYMSVAC